MADTAMQEEFLRCRTFGHAWDDISGQAPPDRHRNVLTLIGARVVLRCTSCGMLREEVWSRANGEMQSRYYTAPEGYAMSGEDLPTRPQLRVEWLRRRQPPAAARRRRAASG